MFKKRPIIKNLAPLRSSDRRKIVDQICREYNISLPQHSGPVEGGETVTNHKSAFRDRILPEGAQWAKFTTSSGKDLKMVNGTLYVAQIDAALRVLWFKLDERIMPTVYTLWNNPSILPLIHTPDAVLRKIQGGADLMTPALALGPPFPPQAIQGAIVAIASVESPSIPLAVGICEIDVAKLENVRGLKGHAVRGIHWFGDEICRWSSHPVPDIDPPESIPGWFPSKTAESDITRSLETLTLDGSPAKSTEKRDFGPINEERVEEKSGGQPNVAIEEEESAATPGKQWSQQEIDEAFRSAFLYAMFSARKANDEASHGISFPIAPSMFVSNFISPYLPIFSHEDAEALQLKKTSWKNVKKFIKALDKELLLKSKDRNGGETVILDVDFEDQKILDFVPYALPKNQPRAGSTTNPASAGSSRDPSLGQELKIVSSFRLGEKLSSVLLARNEKSSQCYALDELKTLVKRYIETSQLVSTENKRLVTMDDAIANALSTSKPSLGKNFSAFETINRDKLVDEIVLRSTPFWTILRNGSADKPFPGPKPMVRMILEKRAGNKVVTKVSGLEVFHIRPEILAEELQKTCASSTSVAPLAGSSPKNAHMELLLQGKHISAVSSALKLRGIAPAWIEILDKSQAKK